jgi:hypothetical protein
MVLEFNPDIIRYFLLALLGLGILTFRKKQFDHIGEPIKHKACPKCQSETIRPLITGKIDSIYWIVLFTIAVLGIIGSFLAGMIF